MVVLVLLHFGEMPSLEPIESKKTLAVFNWATDALSEQTTPYIGPIILSLHAATSTQSHKAYFQLDVRGVQYGL